MTEGSGRIVRNTAWLLGGQMTGRLIRSAIIIYAARVLGAASWGAFSYALGIAAFLTIFADIGINGLLVKEGSKDPMLRKSYLATALFIKLSLIALMAGGTLLFSPLLDTLPEARPLILIALLVFAFDSLRDFVLTVARATEEMHIESIATVLTNLFIATLGFGALAIFGTAEALMASYAAGTAFGLVAALVPLREHFRNVRRHFDTHLIKRIFASAWTFGMISVMGAIMINTDVLMLGWMVSSEEVGLYSAGQKIIQLVYIAPALIATAFFPQMARRAATSKESFRTLFETALASVYLLAVPLTIGGLLMSERIITLLYGPEYAGGSASFAILSATLVIVFPAALVSNAMFAFNEQRKLATYVVLGVTGNIVFNALLIPILGVEGSALSTLMNQLIINIYAWYKLRGIVRFGVFSRLPKIIMSALVMGTLVYALNNTGTPTLLILLAAGTVYGASLLLFKEESAMRALRLMRRT